MNKDQLFVRSNQYESAFHSPCTSFIGLVVGLVAAGYKPDDDDDDDDDGDDNGDSARNFSVDTLQS